jgi:DNA-binding transcriptional LysR family regulator
MRFQRLYPNVKVEITELDMIKIERALLDQTIDIALLLQGTMGFVNNAREQALKGIRNRIIG